MILPTELDPRQISKGSRYVIIPYYKTEKAQIFHLQGAKNKPELFAKILNIAQNMGFQIRRKPNLPIGKIAVYSVEDRKRGRIKLMSDRTWEDWIYVLPGGKKQ